MNTKAKRLQLLKYQTERLQRRLTDLRQRSDQLSRWRLFLFIGGVLLGVVAFFQWGPVVWLWVTAVSLIPFFVSVVIHRRVDTAVTRTTIWYEMKQAHVARMTLAWDALPLSQTFPVPADHPIAIDIDVVGEFSLHRLLDTAVSREGSQRLHQWLLETAPDAARMISSSGCRQAFAPNLGLAAVRQGQHS